jgi:hypothetical protein
LGKKLIRISPAYGESRSQNNLTEKPPDRSGGFLYAAIAALH